MFPSSIQHTPLRAFSTMSKPTTVAEYIDQLPDDRREALEALRKVILQNIDAPFEEGIQYGIVSHTVAG